MDGPRLRATGLFPHSSNIPSGSRRTAAKYSPPLRPVCTSRHTATADVMANAPEDQKTQGFEEAVRPHYHGHRDRLRQRFKSVGHESLADYEILELLLFRYGLKQLPESRSRIGGQPTIAELLSQNRDALLLVLADIVEPGNVGAMIRTAHGLGAAAVITTGSSDPFHPKAVRTAMGSSFKLPIIQFNTSIQALSALKQNNCATYASVSNNGARLTDVTPASGPKAIFKAQTDNKITYPRMNIY